MKKKLLQVILLLSFIVTTWSINHNQQKSSNQFSNLTLENIDALAQNESGELYTHCYKYISSDGGYVGKYVKYCGGCQTLYATSYNNESMCL